MRLFRNNEEMQSRIESLLDYLARALPDTVQGASVPRFAACDHEKKALTLAFDTKAWMRNPAGILHGGMTAMMLDSAMGILSRGYAEGDGITPTITMSVSYLRPIPIGVELHITARAAHTGRAVNNITAEAWVESPDKPAATASGAFFAAGAERPLPKGE